MRLGAESLSSQAHTAGGSSSHPAVPREVWPRSIRGEKEPTENLTTSKYLYLHSGHEESFCFPSLLPGNGQGFGAGKHSCLDKEESPPIPRLPVRIFLAHSQHNPTFPVCYLHQIPEQCFPKPPLSSHSSNSSSGSLIFTSKQLL